MSDYVLNSASVAEPFYEVATARVQLAGLLRGLALLDSDSAALPSLRLNTDPWLQLLVLQGSAVPITLGELAHSFYGTVDHDLAAFFDSLNRSVPADHALNDECIEAILRLVPDHPAAGYEQTFDSVLTAGIDAIICAAMNFVLVGLLRCDLWKYDGMGFISGSETYVFDHVAEPSHADAICRRRIAARRAALTARSSFWPLREQVFPHLLFGLDVQRQAERFSTTLVPLMFSRLAELDARAMKWRETSISDRFPEGSTAITGETPQTMRRYGSLRNFRGHDGVTRTFEDHMWIDRSHRIHMIRDVGTRRVEIGYIGPHLPTMTDPT